MRALHMLYFCEVTHIVWLFTSILTAKIGVVAVSIRVAVLKPSKSYSM
jgi:hypothetical protein